MLSFLQYETYTNWLIVRPFAPSPLQRLLHYYGLCWLLTVRCYWANETPVRPPRLRCTLFPSIYLPHLLCFYKCGSYQTSLPLANLSHETQPYMRFLFVRPEVCLQLPSDFASRRTPLLFSYTFPTTWACSGLTPVRARPWRANIKNTFLKSLRKVFLMGNQTFWGATFLRVLREGLIWGAFMRGLVWGFLVRVYRKT